MKDQTASDDFCSATQSSTKQGLVSIDRKTTVYRLEADDIFFFFLENAYLAVHDNAFLYLLICL